MLDAAIPQSRSWEEDVGRSVDAALGPRGPSSAGETIAFVAHHRTFAPIRRVVGSVPFSDEGWRDRRIMTWAALYDFPKSCEVVVLKGVEMFPLVWSGVAPWERDGEEFPFIVFLQEDDVKTFGRLSATQEVPYCVAG